MVVLHNLSYSQHLFPFKEKSLWDHTLYIWLGPTQVLTFLSDPYAAMWNQNPSTQIMGPLGKELSVWPEQRGEGGGPVRLVKSVKYGMLAPPHKGTVKAERSQGQERGQAGQKRSGSYSCD